MISHPVNKSSIAENTKDLRRLFGQSLALVKPLPKGAELTAEDLTSKKPGTGISPGLAGSLIGRTLNRDVPSDRLLQEDDFVKK